MLFKKKEVRRLFKKKEGCYKKKKVVKKKRGKQVVKKKRGLLQKKEGCYKKREGSNSPSGCALRKPWFPLKEGSKGISPKSRRLRLRAEYLGFL